MKTGREGRRRTCCSCAMWRLEERGCDDVPFQDHGSICERKTYTCEYECTRVEKRKEKGKKGTNLLSSTSQTSRLTSLVDRIADPVDSGISPDRLVGRIDQDDFVVLVNTILVDPVRVQDTQSTTTTSDTLFGSRTKGTLEFEVVDTLVGGLSVSGTCDGEERRKSSDSDFYFFSLSSLDLKD